jgi:hypothetical protein
MMFSNMVGLTICYEVYRLFWGTHQFQCVFYVFYVCTSLVVYSIKLLKVLYFGPTRLNLNGVRDLSE